MRRSWIAVSVFGAASTLIAAAGPAQASGSLPTSMAATGDSITRAFDVNWGGALQDNPAYSWATGTVGSVDSEYTRLAAIDPAVAGHAYNDAETGAKMADLAGQMSTAAAQQAQYVTVLMGANDVCTSSPATMTNTATFTTQFVTAMNALHSADPSVEVFVSSIPNIYQLWSTLHRSFSAQLTWKMFGICQSMLSTSNTEATRQQVLAREVADNNALAAACTGEFAGFCRWDGYATFNVRFASSDVSTVDYFHPSPAGQAKLAATTWAASYWGS